MRRCGESIGYDVVEKHTNSTFPALFQKCPEYGYLLTCWTNSDTFVIIIELNPNKISSLKCTVIFQQILQFNKPIKFVQCLLDLKPQELATIFCDPKGSHLADSYMKSKFIGEKSREKLIRHLEVKI